MILEHARDPIFWGFVIPFRDVRASFAIAPDWVVPPSPRLGVVKEGRAEAAESPTQTPHPLPAANWRSVHSDGATAAPPSHITLAKFVCMELH